MSETSVKNDYVKKTVFKEMIQEDLDTWRNWKDKDGNQPNLSKPDTD